MVQRGDTPPPAFSRIAAISVAQELHDPPRRRRRGRVKRCGARQLRRMALPDPTDPLPIDHGGPVDWPFEPFPAEALQRSICDRFDEMARRHPDRLAVQDMSQRVTYSELSAMAVRIAAAVQSAVSGRDGPVAVLAPTSVGSVASMLGVLAAGRAVVPLDTDHPDQRNKGIAAHAGAVALISAGEYTARARELFPADMRVIDIDAVVDAPVAQARLGPDDLAFILYTSGSTGTPKGVYHNHRNMLFAMALSTRAGHFTAVDRFTFIYSGAVIGGIRNALMALLNGASLHVLSPRLLGTRGLVREIATQRITVFMSVPTVLRRIAAVLGPDQRLDSVRQARFGGRGA